jgi:hypothetical protein
MKRMFASVEHRTRTSFFLTVGMIRYPGKNHEGNPMATMTLIETILTKEFVVVKLASDEDFEEADEWIEFQVPVDALTLATVKGEVELGDVQKRPLASIQQAALRYVRDALNDAMSALPELPSR